jgi:cation transport ATPase
MEQKFSVSGMTCEACIYKVEHIAKQLEGVAEAKASLQDNSLTIESYRLTGLAELDTAFAPHTKYKVSAYKKEPLLLQVNAAGQQIQPVEEKNWLQTYKPILLIFFFITTTTLITASKANGHFLMNFCMHFMAAFFLVFSFFKMLDIKAFAESYAMYDIIAMRFPVYGYIYPFIEFALGIAFLFGTWHLELNIITLVVMSMSIIGVLQSVLNKKKIHCACLGSVFNLPMSTVTVIEDGLMIAMSGWMVLFHMNLLP